MEFLILWLGTSITSFCMEIANELKIFKDVADAGYKIDIERISELNQLNPNASKNTFLSMLIPIFNVMQVFQRAIQYNNTRYILLDSLNVMDVLEEMSEIEKQEYLRKPTGLNALLIPLKTEIRLAKATSIEINNKNENSKITFEIGKSFDDITILKVTGDASKLTLEEQKKKIISVYRKIDQDEIEIEADSEKENFINKLNTNINSNSNDNHIPNDLNISEQKRALKNLKSELLEGQQTIQELHTENDLVLIKKNKK